MEALSCSKHIKAPIIRQKRFSSWDKNVIDFWRPHPWTQVNEIKTNDCDDMSADDQRKLDLTSNQMCRHDYAISTDAACLCGSCINAPKGVQKKNGRVPTCVHNPSLSSYTCKKEPSTLSLYMWLPFYILFSAVTCSFLPFYIMFSFIFCSEEAKYEHV
jgi:hypothetical protein